MRNYFSLSSGFVKERVERLARFDPFTNDRQTILNAQRTPCQIHNCQFIPRENAYFVQLVHKFGARCIRRANVGKPEFRFASTLLFDQLDQLGLVDASMSKAALIGRFIQNHRIIHVISGVGNYSNNSIGSLTVLIHLVKQNKKVNID